MRLFLVQNTPGERLIAAPEGLMSSRNLRDARLDLKMDLKLGRNLVTNLKRCLFCGDLQLSRLSQRIQNKQIEQSHECL